MHPDSMYAYALPAPAVSAAERARIADALCRREAARQRVRNASVKACKLKWEAERATLCASAQSMAVSTAEPEVWQLVPQPTASHVSAANTTVSRAAVPGGLHMRWAAVAARQLAGPTSAADAPSPVAPDSMKAPDVLEIPDSEHSKELLETVLATTSLNSKTDTEAMPQDAEMTPAEPAMPAPVLVSETAVTAAVPTTTEPMPSAVLDTSSDIVSSVPTGAAEPVETNVDNSKALTSTESAVARPNLVEAMGKAFTRLQSFVTKRAVEDVEKVKSNKDVAAAAGVTTAVLAVVLTAKSL